MKIMDTAQNLTININWVIRKFSNSWCAWRAPVEQWVVMIGMNPYLKADTEGDLLRKIINI